MSSVSSGQRVVAPPTCPACGDVLPAAAQFCPGCGRAVHPLKSMTPDESAIGPRTDKPLSAALQQQSPETKADIGELAQFLPQRYKPLKKLGQGGMGTVYQCMDQALERLVAIKIMTERYQSDPLGERRFMREARAQAIVNHPNVATVLNFGVTPEGRLFLVIEYIEGEDLRAIIRREKLIQPLRALDWLRQVCEGLHEAHASGLVHRDLKPSNVMITKDHRGGDWVKILDLGLAKIIGGQSDLRSITMDTAGMLIGTPAYMSPEQVAGSTVDGRADIYSLGVVFFEMLTGHLPFESETMEGWLYKHLHVKPPPPSKLNPDLAQYAQLDNIVMWMMSKEAHERPTTAGEIAGLACRLIESKLSPETQLRPSRKGRTRAFEENPPARKSGPRRAMNFDDMPPPPPDQELLAAQGHFAHLMPQQDPPTGEETRERRRKEFEILANDAENAEIERRWEDALECWNRTLDIAGDHHDDSKRRREACRLEIEVDLVLQQAHSFAEAGDWQMAEQTLNKIAGYHHPRVEQAKARLHRQLMTAWLQLALARIQPLPEGDLRQALMERLSFAHAQAGDMPGALIVMNDATRKPPARLIGLAQALIASIQMGHREGLRPYLDRLTASATALDDPSERGRALLEAGHALTSYGDQSAAAVAFQNSLAAFSEANTKGIPIQVPKRGNTGLLRKGSPDTLRTMSMTSLTSMTATNINSQKSIKSMWETAVGIVAQAQAEAGLVEDSLASAALIEDPWTLAHSLSQVSQALAKTGRSLEAERVASKITFAMPKTQAMRALAVARVYRSDMAGAEEILRTIPTPADRIALQGLLAAAWALRHEKGRAQVWLDETVKLTPEVVGAKARFQALSAALEPLLNSGYLELSAPLADEAAKLIDLIDDPAERLRSMVQLIKLHENARNDRQATTRTIIFGNSASPVVMDLLRSAMVVWRQVRKGPERYECTELLAHCVARASAALLAAEMLAASKDDTEHAMMYIGCCTGVA